MASLLPGVVRWLPCEFLLLASVLCLGFVSAARAADRPPNVLILCADDHAPYVMGAYGNAIVRTPNLDRLAFTGVRFSRAYCNSPVCTASRQSFLTGRYPRTVGVTRLETPLPASEVTLAETLQAAGYDTASFGKMHFNSNLKHGFDQRLDLADYRQWPPARQPIELPAGVEVQPAWRPFKDPARIWLNSSVRPIGLHDEQMDGTYFAQQGAAYLQSRREKPFFLMISFYEPHSPYRFPLEYRDRHRPEEISVPPLGPEDEQQIPAIFRDLTAREKQGIAAAYYTSVEFMDKNVGLVLAALDRSGQADHTIVIYLGDHGYMLGQHGRFEKHCSYEEATRVPLVMRYPGRFASRMVSGTFVELVDLVPTIHELCGCGSKAPVQGRSLLSLLSGQTSKHREHVIVEYAPNEEIMIRDESWKLVYERGITRRTDGYDTERPLVPHWFRLFDLQHDPAEMHNVADDPAHAATRQRLTGLLAEHLIQTARQPELTPKSDDPLTILDFCVQPRDVAGPNKPK